MTPPINASAPSNTWVAFTKITQAIEELILAIKFKEMFLEMFNLIFKLICNGQVKIIQFSITRIRSHI